MKNKILGHKGVNNINITNYAVSGNTTNEQLTIFNTLNLSEYVTPHALRHSCATHVMEYSGELREIQELLGHSSIASTQIYADVAKKYITEVYDKCHPLSQENRKDN